MGSADLHLETVNCAAVDERGILSQAIPEGIANGAEAQNYMDTLLALLYEKAPQLYRALKAQLACS